MLSTADQRRNEFFEWLATRVSSSQLSDLYDAFEEIDTFCQDRGILSPNLFLFTKASQVRQLRANLEAHRLYRYVGRLKTKRILSGLSHFETFLNTPQKVSEIQHKSPIQSSSNTSLNANNNDQSVEKVHPKVNPTYPQIEDPLDEHKEEPADTKDELIEMLESAGKHYIDARSKGGCLWVPGNYDDIGFFIKCNQKGYPFRYAKNGGKSTKGESAWYLDDKNANSAQAKADRKPFDDTEVSKIFHSSEFSILRTELGKAHVFSLEDLKKIRLWSFMEERKLYPSSERYEIYSRANQLVKAAINASTQRVETTKPVVTGDATEPSKDSNKGKENTSQSSGESSKSASQQVTNEDSQQTNSDESQGTASPNSLREQFQNWLIRNKYVLTTIYNYVSAIAEASRFALQHSITQEDFYVMSDAYDISVALDALMGNAVFSAKNSSQGNRYRAALRKYSEFLSECCNTTTSSERTPHSDDRWTKVLMEQFPDGYTIGDFISQFQAAGKWSELYNEDCPLQGDAIDAVMRGCGTVKDGRVYLSKAEEGKLIDEIANVIREVLKQYTGANVESVYEHYRDKLAENAIYSSDVMSQQIVLHSAGKFIKKGTMFTAPNKSASIIEDCKQVLRSRGSAMSVTAVAEILWFYPYDAVYNALNSEDECIRIARGTWMLIEHFPFSKHDALEVSKMLNDELQLRDHILVHELNSLIQKTLPAIAVNLSSFDQNAIFGIIRFYLGGHFTFSQSAVTKLGQTVNIKSLFDSFSKEHEHFNMDELVAFADEHHVSIYWNTVLANALRINSQEFISAKLIHFDVERIDSALNDLCPDDYAPLPAIQTSMMTVLPSCGYPWNGYLLQSYLNGHSDNFTLCNNSFSKNGFYGAIVRKNAKSLCDYSSLVEQVLTDSNTWNSAEDALALLVSNGYQERRRFDGIEQIMERAKLRKINE